jgi:ribonuclease BN (tRNA processing enzyme)
MPDARLRWKRIPILDVGEDVQMRLTVVGSSPAWPNPGGAQSGYLVEGTGRLLLDCGPGVLARLREREDWPRLDAIAITHFHLDHWGDIVPWVWGTMFRFDGDRPRPQLWLPPHGRTLLERFEGTLGSPKMFERTFELREYQPRQPFSAAGLEVTAIQVPHYQIETYGFRVSDGSATLAYSGDSGPADELVDLARDADLFLCEATLERGDLDGQPRGHLSAEEAVAAFEASGAKRLLVTHRPDELALDDRLERARDGLELEL